MDILGAGKKKIREIPDDRMRRIGRVGTGGDSRDVWEDSETGRRYLSHWGRRGVTYISRKHLKEFYSYAI